MQVTNPEDQQAMTGEEGPTDVDAATTNNTTDIAVWVQTATALLEVRRQDEQNEIRPTEDEELKLQKKAARDSSV